MRASLKFLRYLDRGADPIQVVASIFTTLSLGTLPEVAITLTEKTDAKPRWMAIRMSPDEARSLAQSLLKYAESAGDLKFNHAETDRLGEEPNAKG